MFVVVAVNAQQLPVAAIARVVIVIMVTVMHGEFLQVNADEFAGTTAANPRVLFEFLHCFRIIKPF